MDKNLTIQEALTKLLAEKKSLLNDSKALMSALKETVSPAYSMELSFLNRALTECNIGETLLLADKSDNIARDKAKAEVLARLNKIHMAEKNSKFVVQTLTEALGWQSSVQAKSSAVQAESSNVQTESPTVQTESPNAQAEPSNVQTESSNAQTEPSNAQAESSNAQAEPSNAQTEPSNAQAESSNVQLVRKFFPVMNNATRKPAKSKKARKFFPVILLMMLTIIGSFFPFKAVSAAENPFRDVPFSHWAYNAVTSLAAKGINEGYGDGTFRGDRYITRYEVAAMLDKIHELSRSGKSDSTLIRFSDVPSEHWASNSVRRLSMAGISQGYNDGSFRGENSITRYEMAVMVSKLLSDEKETATGAMPFYDIPSGHWAYNAVAFLAAEGISDGYGDGTFRGDRNITRYEAAMMLSKAMLLMKL